MDAHTADDAGKRIKQLRTYFGENHLVAFFTSPDNLAKEVIAAVRRQELSTQLELKSLQAVDAHRWMMNPKSILTQRPKQPKAELTRLSTSMTQCSPKIKAAPKIRPKNQ